VVKNNPEPSIRALGKYLKIDDREALEEVYRLYREIYPSVPHVSPAAIQLSSPGWPKKIQSQSSQTGTIHRRTI